MINVTVDCVILTRDLSHVLLITRKNDPFKGRWALPGGFLDEYDKSLRQGAARELEEETGLKVHRLWQVGTWGSPDRDPRGYTVTVAFFGLVAGLQAVVGQDDATKAEWVEVKNACGPHTLGQGLAFDHEEIIQRALLAAS